jgi:hypothetical protein
MTADERLDALEQRIAALERETYTDLERRLVRNTDTATATLRAAQPDPVTMQRNTLVSERRPLAQRQDVLLRLVGEVNRDLAEHRATPKPTHGVERDLWIRKEEELLDTLDEINKGRDLSGYFARLARRDGIPLQPGLIATKNAIARLESELATLPAS